ncbi:DUF3825 domain-containing protein [Atopobium minutum]|uniref:DUF3825 domain-containing protein n=1 Tax=Atopobium minutum TaxID=1381 RepID=UPI0029084F00|nr:DUF3825 domain-containing protein [Atopobium minutum]MDU5130286.1 DUF3825 domain-containing protein [Atopobium minutum]
MATISKNNALYLYKLLKEELGCGIQTPLSTVEAILMADEITPVDLDCADINALMTALPDFVKLTVFKKGRVFVTIIPNEEFDSALDKLDEPSAADKAAAKRKPWKRRHSAKALRPQKPRHKEVPASKPIAEPEPETMTTVEVDVEAKTIAVTTTEPEPEPTPDLAPTYESELTPDPTTDPESEPDLTPEPAPAPIPEAPSIPAPTISLNITHTPQQQSGEPAIPAQTFAVPSQVEAYIPVVLQSSLPQDFINDVACPTDLLEKIYDCTPANTNALELLQTSWTVARSTGSLSGTRSTISFVLTTSTNTLVTIQKNRASTTSKPWKVTSIITNNNRTSDSAYRQTDDTNQTLSCACDELLITRTSAQPQAAALTALAQYALIGSWESVASALKDFMPAHSFTPHELCSYLSAVFYRAQHSERLSETADGTFAAFNTGLLTPFNEDIYLCFTPSAKATPWQFAGFSTTHTPGLQEQLAALPQLPQAPHFEMDAQLLYIATNAQLEIPAKHLANMLPDSILETLSKQDFFDACTTAFKAAQRNYRLIAPVYSTELNQTLVALPLQTAGLDAYALVLTPVEKGYELVNVVARRIARGAAQVISLELPDWLA